MEGIQYHHLANKKKPGVLETTAHLVDRRQSNFSSEGIFPVFFFFFFFSI
jgi:hypothetical protein